MIQGFTYFGGPTGDVLPAKPASAFSKGDLLMLDSTSSVSRFAELAPSGTDILGIALSDSNQSIGGEVMVLVPDADTLFLVSLATNCSSAVTPGCELDTLYAVANGRCYATNASANSVRVVAVRGTAGPQALDQSTHSQIVGKLIRHAGNIELS
jgi:hypothetical protein